MPAKTKPRLNGSSPENDPTFFEGKPGPAPTGLKRKIQVPFMVSEEEFEYLKRISRSAGLTVNASIRVQVISKKWRSQLKHLRKMQGANI